MARALGLYAFLAVPAHALVFAPARSAVGTALRSELAAPGTANGAFSALATTAPKVVTLEVDGLLMERTLPTGLMLRDALMGTTGLMLPRPDVFEAAHVKAAAAAAPRFGAGTEAAGEAWARGVAKATCDAVVLDPFRNYDSEELAAYASGFEAAFDAYYAGDATEDVWTLHPQAPRLLSALREWRDVGGGPRVVAVSESVDGRLDALLRRLLGDDAVDATFDAVVCAVEGAASVFDAAAAIHRIADSSCEHAGPYAPADCPYKTNLVDTSDAVIDRDDVRMSSPLDLIDELGLPRIDDDDVIITSRPYSVYDPEPAGYSEGDEF